MDHDDRNGPGGTVRTGTCMPVATATAAAAGVGLGMAARHVQARRAPIRMAIPERLAGLQQPDVARTAQRLLFAPQDWIYRRVDQIEFADFGAHRRRTSIDFVAVVPGARRGRRPEGVVPYPVATLEKRPLVDFDVRDHRNRALSVLTREENTLLTTALVRELLEAAAGPVPPALVLDLAAVCGGEPGATSASGRRIRAWLDGVLPEDRLRESFAGLLDWFAEQFVLYALVPPDGRRRVIKFSYLEPSIPPWQLGAVLARSFRTARAVPGAPDGPAGIRRAVGTAIRNASATLVQRLGWAPAILEIPAVSVGWGRSYHLEVHAPAELETVESELVVAGPAGNSTVVPGRSDGSSTHILTGRVDAWSRGRAYVSVQVPRLGLLRTAAVLTLLSTIFFAAMAPLVGQLVEDEAGVRTAPLLLGAVGVLVGALSRPGEHALAADMLRLRRAMLLAVGVLYGIGAVALLVVDAAAGMTRLWWLLTAVSAVLTALLGASFVQARPAARGRIEPG